MKPYSVEQLRTALGDYDMARDSGITTPVIKLDPVKLTKELLQFLEGKRQ